jgi:D-3-phosphoglycerate dehydrogenase
MRSRRKTMPLVVITDCDHGNIVSEEAVFRAAGVECRLHQVKSEDEVIALAHDADAVIFQYAPITGRVLDGLPRCRVAVRYGVGVDTADLAAATERGVVIVNIPDYCMEEVSDHALAMGLALWRGVVLYDRAIRGGTWKATMKTPMSRLRGKVAGVIGVGRIGTCFAQKIASVGMTVIGYDPYLPVLPQNVRKVSFQELLKEADLISLHLPLNAETKHLINEAALRLMKPTALLLNTARGGLVDTEALCRALKDGRIGGAALDTLEREPIPADSPLLSYPNVILAPHAGWYSDQSIIDLKRKAAEAALAVLRGQRPYSPVNPEVYEGSKLRGKEPLLKG